jgi:poly-gamma-glutamate capsule biosynthesis protein CapA/YwtB (metallophosphatase superfamily)
MVENGFTLFLCGDVMTGRGMDQILPYPGDTRLYEPAVKSASEYVALAEMANGPIRQPVGFSYVWGDLLAELERRQPDARIINLETSITDSAAYEAKGINYKMSPRNVPVIGAAGIDCCVLANNHVLDWGCKGLCDTIDALTNAGVKFAGIGRNSAEAGSPAIIEARDGRVVIFGFGSTTSGIPGSWAASTSTPGINLLEDFSDRTVDRIARDVRARKQTGDLVVISIHWGGNWGYHISVAQTRFAHALIDQAGVDLIHGHSSHHAKAIEIYKGRVILYGCGDFLNDYEGIPGYETFRGDLVLAYFPTFDRRSAELKRFEMVPFRIRKFRLEPPSRAETDWLVHMLNREGKQFRNHVQETGNGNLALCWR